jgi:hypothetical protein
MRQLDWTLVVHLHQTLTSVPLFNYSLWLPLHILQCHCCTYKNSLLNTRIAIYFRSHFPAISVHFLLLKNALTFKDIIAASMNFPKWQGYLKNDFIGNRVKRSNFRGPRGILARTSRTRGVIKSIPRGIEE